MDLRGLRGLCDRVRDLGHVLRVDQLKDDNHVRRQDGVGEEKPEQNRQIVQGPLD